MTCLWPASILCVTWCWRASVQWRVMAKTVSHTIWSSGLVLPLRTDSSSALLGDRWHRGNVGWGRGAGNDSPRRKASSFVGNGETTREMKWFTSITPYYLPRLRRSIWSNMLSPSKIIHGESLGCHSVNFNRCIAFNVANLPEDKTHYLISHASMRERICYYIYKGQPEYVLLPCEEGRINAIRKCFSRAFSTFTLCCSYLLSWIESACLYATPYSEP